MSVVRRSKNKTSVAAAAYCSGSKIKDERLGETFDYRTKEGVITSKILAPENTPDWCFDRKKLWNKVEKFEKRRDAQVARAITVAFPKDLSLSYQEKLLTDFAHQCFVSQGMIADLNIHHDNPENPHAHILLTMRPVNENGFGNKEREWNKKPFLEKVRTTWEELANKNLEAIGSPHRITKESHATRGLAKEPGIHLGPQVYKALKQGVQPPPPRAKRNEDIKRKNKVYWNHRYRNRFTVNSPITKGHVVENQAPPKPSAIKPR